MAQKTLDSPDHYTVGWIAALSIERAAATALLDEVHSKPQGFSQHPSDTNSYTWGRMGEHNLVIASLQTGKYGTTSAATTASGLLSSLPQIRIGLLVGIGGGIPRPDEGIDIRLGDVVVSEPDGATGGVIQHDLIKAKSGSEREPKGFLNMPPAVLLNALSSLQASHELEEPLVNEFLSKMLTDKPRMAKAGYGYIHQGVEHDQLFNEVCDKVPRPARDSTDPVVHYGIIASGNTLVKDAAERDRIAKHVGGKCLCVEMEAAGLMNHFPCLVIRGISDYADAHKNDRWQRYASATAAAFGKELLSYVPFSDLQQTRRAVELLESIDTRLQQIEPQINSIFTGVATLASESHLSEVKKWLSPPDPSTNRNAAAAKRHEGTGNWFLTSPVFVEWKSGLRRHLWLHGLAGCGKTILSATILDHLHEARPDSLVCLEFFFDFSDKNKQHLDDLLRSLAFQLYSQCSDARYWLDALFTRCNNGQTQPTTAALSCTIHEMMQRASKIQIVLDALDESVTGAKLLEWMRTLASTDLTHVHLVATSRREQELESGLSPWIGEDDRIPLEKDPVNEDIRSYVKARLQRSEAFQKRWASLPSALELIETQIGSRADGMFRWAACQLDTLEHCLDYDELERALCSLPEDLDETYSRILKNIPEARQEKAIRILQFLVYSERPLRLDEAVDAIATRLDGRRPFDPKYRLQCPSEITRFCPSLVSLVTGPDYFPGETTTELHLAHFSVKEYLMSSKLPEPFRRNLSEPEARSSITRCCLAYFSSLPPSLLTAPIRPLHHWYSFPSRKRSIGAKVREQFPLGLYWGMFWLNHIKAAETVDGMAATFADFCQNQTAFAIWDRLLSALESWAQRHGNEPKGVSPLYMVSLNGLNVTVQKLLQQGADVNASGGPGGNALQAASYRGYVEVVQTLLENGADVSTRCGPIHALHYAAEHGHKEIVRLLLEKGADPSQGDGEFGITALEAACLRDDTDIVRMLLAEGAEVNAESLTNARMAGHRKTFQKLARVATGGDAQEDGLEGDYLTEWGERIEAAEGFEIFNGFERFEMFNRFEWT